MTTSRAIWIGLAWVNGPVFLLLCGPLGAFAYSENSQIATLVERQTRYVMLVKVACKDSETVVNALIKSACASRALGFSSQKRC